MCGISGVCYNRKIERKEAEEWINKMIASQSRRGPDDTGSFFHAAKSASVVLGHNRLSIIDLSKSGHQPMEFDSRKSKIGNSKSAIRVTFNGEIYNFQELKKELEKKGYKFKTHTDTEVILAMYDAYGAESFGKLRGMFAFGLWDETKQKLFLVRDHYGIKPIYYYVDDNKIIFASTVGALKSSGLIPIVDNKDAWISFLLFGSVSAPLTTIKDVHGLPAGSFLEWSAEGSWKIERYYNMLEPFMRKQDASKEEAAESVREKLSDSVEKHLISDAPLGVFLSGGLDSSAIAALSAEALRKGGAGRKITTLSIDFEEDRFSERAYQKMVADKIGSDHRSIKVTEGDFEESFDEIFEAMDQPTIDGVNTFFVSLAAKKAGLKAVLSGLGGDEVFGGYPSFQKADLLRHVQQLPGALRLPLNIFSKAHDKYEKIAYLTHDHPLYFYLSIRGLFTPKKVAEILGISTQDVARFLDTMGNNRALFPNELWSLDPIDMLSYLELKFYLHNQLLKDTDFMSMYHSIEVRVPFLDRPLIEYVSSLDPKLRLSQDLAGHKIGDVNKPLLVASMRGQLPDEIFTRKKMGFTFPFEDWLKQSSRISGKLADDFKSGRLHWSRFWATCIISRNEQ